MAPPWDRSRREGWPPSRPAAAGRCLGHGAACAVHSALADALAAEALGRQVGRYGLLTEFDAARCFCRDTRGRAVFAFGNHAGRQDEVARTDPGYVRWMLGQSFRDAVQGLIRRAPAGQPLTRETPSPPATSDYLCPLDGRIAPRPRARTGRPACRHLRQARRAPGGCRYGRRRPCRHLRSGDLSRMLSASPAHQTAIKPWVTIAPAVAASGPPKLQFGHGDQAVGNSRLGLDRLDGLGPSIRPRRSSRG